MEWLRGDFVISTDQDRIDVDAVHRFLCDDSYWAAAVPVDVVRRSIQNSLCFGVYLGDQQVGFARVITDYATFAYIADVYVVTEYRRQGLAKWLMNVIREHPELQGLRRWLLVTRDAHGLYSGAGFRALENPDRWMEIRDRDVYVVRK